MVTIVNSVVLLICFYILFALQSTQKVEATKYLLFKHSQRNILKSILINLLRVGMVATPKSNDRNSKQINAINRLYYNDF